MDHTKFCGNSMLWFKVKHRLCYMYMTVDTCKIVCYTVSLILVSDSVG